MTASQSSQTFDTGQQALGQVYAKALIGAAEKAGNTDTVLEELDSLLHDVLANQPQLSAALASPRVSHEEKERILDKAFQGKMCAELLTFLKVTSRHGRLDCLGAIGAAARQIHNELVGRQDVVVRTATPLTVKMRDQITKQLQKSLGAEIVLSEEVDADLLGGIVVRIGDKLFDGSVANKLERLRETTLARTGQDLRDSSQRFIAEDLKQDD